MTALVGVVPSSAYTRQAAAVAAGEYVQLTSSYIAVHFRNA